MNYEPPPPIPPRRPPSPVPGPPFPPNWRVSPLPWGEEEDPFRYQTPKTRAVLSNLDYFIFFTPTHELVMTLNEMGEETVWDFGIYAMQIDSRADELTRQNARTELYTHMLPNLSIILGHDENYPDSVYDQFMTHVQHAQNIRSLREGSTELLEVYLTTLAIQLRRRWFEIYTSESLHMMRDLWVEIENYFVSVRRGMAALQEFSNDTFLNQVQNQQDGTGRGARPRDRVVFYPPLNADNFNIDSMIRFYRL